MRILLNSFFLLLVSLFLLGMGGLGGEPEGTLPETEHDFSVRVTDRSGTETSLTRFSMDGSTFLHGQLGSASVTIAFEDIQTATFKSIVNEKIKVALSLKEGKEMTIDIRRRSGFAGQMDVGIYRIKAEAVSRIDFK